MATYSWNPDRGQLKPLQILLSVPADFTGDNRAAEIAISPSGHNVYVSNRGHDSIGHFSVSPTSGLLTPVEWGTTKGKGPRFFALDPAAQHLYAANELTDTIVDFAVHDKTGRLSSANQVLETGSPVCITFVEL